MEWEIPDTLTFEFLDEQEWRPGPLDHFEICELGLVRRPLSLGTRKGVMYPGTLYTPEPRGRTTTRYRLHLIGNRRPIYIPPEEALTKAFGVFRNHNLKNVAYVLNMRAIALGFNAKYFKQEKRLAYQDAEEEGMLPMRRCATCGKKTRSYRCEACWTKIRAGETSCDEPNAEYRLGRR